jgi:hypothetical protein
MIISSIDLYYASRCPKMFLENSFPIEEDNPSRKLIKEFFLMRTIGKEQKWTSSSIAKMWDNLFWLGRDITRENINLSVKGTIAARKLYDKLPLTDDCLGMSSDNLIFHQDAGRMIKSSTDFILVYPDRIEGWLYSSLPIKQIRKSPLPDIEAFITRNRIKGNKKDYYLVVYKISPNMMNPTYIRINELSEPKNQRRIIYHLEYIIRNKVNYSITGEHCKKCSIGC